MKPEMHRRPLRLAVVTHSFPPAIGGVETFIDHLIAKLDKGKYDITIFTSSKNLKAKPYRYQHDGISVHVIKSLVIAGIIVPVSLISLVNLLRHLKKTDIVHQHDIKFLSGFLVFFHFLFSYRLILFSHGYMYHSNRFGLLKKAYMKYFAFLSKGYTRIINISEPDFLLAKKFKFSNIAFIKEAVDLSHFQNNPKQEVAGRYLYFGRIAPNKGLDNLFRCLATIPCRDFVLDIIGNGACDYVQQLKNLAVQLKIEEHIFWHGNVADDTMLNYISTAEIIFLPSVYEGFGISLLESIASRSRFMAHTNQSYVSILTELELTHFLFNYEQPEKFEKCLDAILCYEINPCKKLLLYDHDHMVQLIEGASGL
jgi:glycosyltransferase involved in cell wall biosynthesis